MRTVKIAFTLSPTRGVGLATTNSNSETKRTFASSGVGVIVGVDVGVCVSVGVGVVVGVDVGVVVGVNVGVRVGV